MLLNIIFIICLDLKKGENSETKKRVWEIIKRNNKILTILEKIKAEDILHFAIAIQAFGYAVYALRDKLMLNSVEFAELGVSPWLVQLWVPATAVFFVFVGVMIFREKNFRYPLLLGLAVLSLSLFKTFERGQYFGLVPASHAGRFIPPLMLAFLWNRKKSLSGDLHFVLRFAISATFIGHGIKCLLHSGSMIKLINGFGTSFGWEFQESTILLALDVIGLVDIFVAAWFIVAPSFLASVYMAVWAFLAANSRFFVGGFMAFDELFIRSCYYLVPCALFWNQFLGSKIFRRLKNFSAKQASTLEANF